MIIIIIHQTLDLFGKRPRAPRPTSNVCERRHAERSRFSNCLEHYCPFIQGAPKTKHNAPHLASDATKV